jgi:O-antigen/teichoic acid export membrane protein
MYSIAQAVIKRFFVQGHERTIRAKKNIFGSFLFKGGSVVINLIMVPLTLNYLNPEKYGIWLTLVSIAGWIEFLDIGLGNGLRNKLAEAMAVNDTNMAKKLVSTTYAMVTIMSTSIFVLFFLINPLINWSKVLNTSSGIEHELHIITIIVIGFFSLRFILQLINTILLANQKPAVNSFITFISNIVALLVVYVFTIVSKGSLFNLSLIMGLHPLALIVVSLYYFNNKYKAIKPGLKYIDFSQIKLLAGLGVKFFIIQLSCIVLYTSDNFIISNLFGPAQVSVYSIAYKYFGITATIFTIINMPFWSAYTEAYQKGDYEWIKSINYKLRQAWVVVTILGLLLLIFSNFMFKAWIGNSLKIPLILSIFMFLYHSLQNWANIYIYFINGIARIKLQTVWALISAIINIPMSIFLAKYMGMGVTGVILGSTISILYGPTIIAAQYFKIIKGNATGIWKE